MITDKALREMRKILTSDVIDDPEELLVWLATDGVVLIDEILAAREGKSMNPSKYLVIIGPKAAYETPQGELLATHAETPSDMRRLEDWLSGNDDYPYVTLLRTRTTIIRL